MSMPKGTNCGGVRKLEDLRLRCRVDQDTGCWHFGGKEHRRQAGKVDPRVWLADRRSAVTVAKAGWLLAGKPLKLGEIVWPRCRTHCCGNPSHLMAGTKAQWGAWAQAQGYMRGRPERAAINRRIKLETGQCALTMELAAWIRESTQTGREIAQVLGVSEQVVSRARLGKTYAAAPVASIFGWAHLGGLAA